MICEIVLTSCDLGFKTLKLARLPESTGLLDESNASEIIQNVENRVEWECPSFTLNHRSINLLQRHGFI